MKAPVKSKKMDLFVNPTNPMLLEIEKNIIAKVSKENRDVFNRTIITAKRMLFSPETHANMQLIKSPASRENPIETISTGVAGLMWLLYQQSKKTLPAEVLIYGGIIAAVEVWDFAERGLKIQITPETIARTTQAMCETLFKKMGISPKQLSDAIVHGKKITDEYSSHQAYMNKKFPEVMTKKGGK